MTLLATLPGLPMLAPGQLEGYREKYGMDQQAPLNAEQPDENFVRRYGSDRPLMKRRGEFASPHALAFPACSKSSNVIVYFAGSVGRHLVVFNNSARGESVLIGGDDFLACFPPEAQSCNGLIVSPADLLSSLAITCVLTASRPCPLPDNGAH